MIIICRTSAEEFSSKHVKHPADPSLSLNKDGIFPKAYRRNVDVRFFSMSNLTSYQGQLGEEYLRDILVMMGLT